jgi:hypothetical protein
MHGAPCEDESYGHTWWDRGGYVGECLNLPKQAVNTRMSRAGCLLLLLSLLTQVRTSIPVVYRLPSNDPTPGKRRTHPEVPPLYHTYKRAIVLVPPCACAT